jgi:hypothetical protein
MLNKDIKEAEEALVMMLPAYANATNLDSIVEEHTDYDLVLDSGAMMASGDANRVPGGAADRKPIERPMAVLGVHGQAKPISRSSSQ